MSEHDTELKQRLDDIWSFYTLNSNRMERLIQMGVLFRSAKDWEDYYEYVDESLRAVIVLLHASLEDALREIVRLKLTECPAEVLKEIPLVGLSPTGQPRKFSLGELSKHRGKTVDELIQQSIDEFLNKTSFNSSNDIAHMLEKKLRIDISNLREYFPALNQMIARRHQIVHTADRTGAPGDLSLAPVDGEDIIKWLRTAAAFLADVLSAAYPDLQIAEGTGERMQELLARDSAAPQGADLSATC